MVTTPSAPRQPVTGKERRSHVQGKYQGLALGDSFAGRPHCYQEEAPRFIDKGLLKFWDSSDGV